MNQGQIVRLGSALFALAVFASVSADAQESGRRSFAHGPRMHQRLGAEAPLISLALKHQTELKLTPDQVLTLEKVRTQFQNQGAPIQEQLRSIESEIRGDLQESPANLIQIRLKIEQAEKLRSELRYLRVEVLENGKAVLTAEQKGHLKNLLASRRDNFRRSQGQPS
jgi:Spy/CpxP family protein refolding chaperone